MISLTTAAPAVGAAFVASLVEVVEAFTIVLAAGTLRGWRGAVAGTAAGLAALALIVVALGPLLDQVPLHLLQLVIGVLLLLFGMGWLRKAVLRAAGIIALHDENAAFATETANLSDTTTPRRSGFDWLGGVMAFKAVLLEGLEVEAAVHIQRGEGGLYADPRGPAEWPPCVTGGLCGHDSWPRCRRSVLERRLRGMVRGGKKKRRRPANLVPRLKPPPGPRDTRAGWSTGSSLPSPCR